MPDPVSSPSRHSRGIRWRWLLPAALIALAFHLLPIGGPALDWAFFDAASRHPLRAPPVPAGSALVMVDETTMAAMHDQGLRWPYPRAAFAAVIAALDRAGARRILVDFTFLEASDSADQDLMLAATAAAARNTVLGRTTSQAPAFWSPEYIKAHAEFFSKPRTAVTDLIADDDGITRRYQVRDSLADAALNQPTPAAEGLLRWHGGLKKFQELGVPVLPAAVFIQRGMFIEGRLAEQAPEFSPEGFAKALAAEPMLTGGAFDLVRDKIVFVGANASGTFDLKPMPVGKIEPGTLLHWTAWANLESGGFIAALPHWGGLVAAIIAATALLLVAGRWPGITLPICSALGLVLAFLAAAYALLSAGWFFPPATPVMAVALTLLGIVAENFWTEQRRKREIQTMFGAYVDPAVVAQLVHNPDSIRLAGERREATVFFSDLAGFTDLSEKLPPEQMVEVVNAYLEETSECLHRHHAYVDKYIGDAVMAVFGVPQSLPDHAVAACRAALEAHQAIATINLRYAAKVGVKLKVRIGLNTGVMIVGNLGSTRKRNYTVMGDAVNLASRLEGANKEFGTEILLGETTARMVAGQMATRPLTRLRVKGKLVAIEVHELVGIPAKLLPAQREFLAAYLPAYAHYTARRFAEAAIDFDRALAVRKDDDVTRELLEQSLVFSHQPPPADWEPILTLKSK